MLSMKIMEKISSVIGEQYDLFYVWSLVVLTYFLVVLLLILTYSLTRGIYIL
jgi:hypothetical protein